MAQPVRGRGGTSKWPVLFVVAIFLGLCVVSWLGRSADAQNIYQGCLRSTTDTWDQVQSKRAESREHVLGAGDPHISMTLRNARLHEARVEFLTAKDMLLRTSPTPQGRSMECRRWYPEPNFIPGLPGRS